MKALKGLAASVKSAGACKKLANVTVSRGKTAWPKKQADLESVGVRFDYDGQVEQNGNTYEKFQIQPNAGKIPASIKEWREKNGGTHAVLTTIYVKKDASDDEVEAAIEKGLEDIRS